MKIPHKAHVAVVDGESFLLMQNEGQAFEPRLKSLSRPDLSASNFSAGVKHQDDIGQRHGRTDLNELAHGAAAAEWLNGKAIANEIEDLLVIADPKTLGEMRRHYHGELEKRLVGEIAKTMTSAPARKIASAIVEA